MKLDELESKVSEVDAEPIVLKIVPVRSVEDAVSDEPLERDRK